MPRFLHYLFNRLIDSAKELHFRNVTNIKATAKALDFLEISWVYLFYLTGSLSYKSFYKLIPLLWLLSWSFLTGTHSAIEKPNWQSFLRSFQVSVFDFQSFIFFSYWWKSFTVGETNFSVLQKLHWKLWKNVACW